MFVPSIWNLVSTTKKPCMCRVGFYNGATSNLWAKCLSPLTRLSTSTSPWNLKVMEQDSCDEKLFSNDPSPRLREQSHTSKISRWTKTPTYNVRRIICFLIAGTGLMIVFISLTIHLCYKGYPRTIETLSIPSHDSRSTVEHHPAKPGNWDANLISWWTAGYLRRATTRHYLKHTSRKQLPLLYRSQCARRTSNGYRAKWRMGRIVHRLGTPYQSLLVYVEDSDPWFQSCGKSTRA